MIAQHSDTPRLGPLEAPYEPGVARTLERLMGGADADPLLLFRTIAHNAALLDKLRSTGTYLLNFGTVEPIEREIVILRTCARCGSEYEWGVHVAIFADAVGLTPDQVRSTVTGDTGAFSDQQRLLVRLVEELHDTSRVSDELWTQLAAIWSPAQLVELVTLVGQYHTVSFWTNTFRVALEPFAECFPS